MREDSTNPYIKQTGSYLLVELPRGDVTQVAEVYRDFAVVCIKQQIARVLLKVLDDDFAGERALRDTFTTILLAGIAPNFRIALMAANQRVEATYRIAQRDLCLANVNTRIFDSEDAAIQWLEGSARPGSPDSRAAV